MENLKKNFSKNNLFRQKINPEDGRIHFIAIGGIGMSGLAKVMLELGYKVSGSDIKNNSIMQSLENAGALINTGHSAENICDCSLIVVSSAIKQDNPELQEAVRQNIPIIHRAQLLETLMSGFGQKEKKFSIGVTGTHGKTTTSGMLAFAFEKAGRNPSFVVGGQLPLLNINSRAGNGSCFISELDESDGSIELYSPDITVITNIEFDHADHYESGLEQILDTFERYVNQLGENAKLIINSDDSGNLRLLKRIDRANIITYSSDSSHIMHNNSDYRAEIISTVPNAEMKVYRNGEFLGEVTLGIPGEHNISNALGAIAAALESGIGFSDISGVFKQFNGMKRRFQTVGYVKGARIIDDYAHHPTEIAKTLKTAKEITDSINSGRVIAVFQPHRYSRLQNLWQDFVDAFRDADIVYICDVYPAGEDPVDGINSENLAKEIDYTGSFYIVGDMEKIAESVALELRENDFVFTMGAGDITRLGQIIVEKAGYVLK